MLTTRSVAIVLTAMLAATAAVAQGVRAADPAPVAKPEAGGVKIGNPSFIRKLVSAEKVEQLGTLQYQQLTDKEAKSGRLLPTEHPQVARLRQIAQDLLPHTGKFNDRAKAWKWEVNVLALNQVNAFCMPGGKIAFFVGILDRLKLTDDEVAVVMGHEIAHALREHARERMAKQLATQGGAILVGVLTGSRLATDLAQGAGNLLGLKFSRDDETEADLIGMELAARAGYDPRAGVTLWQKMSAAAKGAPPQWLSTHPSSATRIDTIKANLKDVLPLYEAARKNRG